MAEAPAWLRFLFGLDRGEIPAGADTRFELLGLWRGGAGWLACAIIAAAVILIVLLYRRERELSAARRGVLAAIRLLALLLVLWMLLDPRIMTEIHHKRAATTYVLLDTSASMSVQDAYEDVELRALETATGTELKGPQERAALALAAASHQKLVERLAEKNQVKVFAFDSTLRALDGLKPGAFKAPGGSETRLADGIVTALKQSGTEPVAGVVVISDGRATGGAQLARGIAEAAQHAAPIFTVGVGRTVVPRNLAVLELSGPDVTIPGFPVRLEGRVQATGIRGAFTATLQRQKGKNGPTQKVEDRTFEVKTMTSTTSLVFVDTPPDKGIYRYTLKIEPHPEETEAADNLRTLQITAAEEKCRVLLVSGGPTPEYKFLNRFLIRDDGLQASSWLATQDSRMPQDGDVVLKALPATLDELRAFDVVILLDPDAKSLSDGFLAALRELVLDQGGGVAYVAGEYYSEDLFRLERLAPLRAVLPIDFDARAGRPPTAPGARRPAARTAWRPLLTRQGADHPLCRLADDPAENEKIWTRLPGIHYSMSVRALKPAAAPLLEKAGGDVVAAVQKSGAGTSVFLSTDDLHAWRSWKEEHHDRFWGSVVRFLALGKHAAGSGDSLLHTDRDRYAVGEEIVFEASLTDADRKPVIKDRVEVSVELLEAAPGQPGQKDPGTEKSNEAASTLGLNLLPIAERPGWYTGRLSADRAGKYSAHLPGGESGVAPRVTFSVVNPSSEWEDTSPDPTQLEDLSRATGGAHWPLVDLGEVPDRIGDRSIIETVGRTSSTVWDSAALMIGFAVLLTLEWSLRKLWRLN